MPKIIAPKRTSKSVTVEDYWAIRQKFGKQKQVVNYAYKEQEVEKRHRFEKLTNQIKAFNPLDYFITKDQDFSTNVKTHTHAYLESINYRLPEEIMDVKKHMFGLASILKNIARINRNLWDHLGTDDAWKLIQTLLKDTRDQPYDLWISEGLEKLVQGISTQFKQSLFKHIFHTLCIFMEVCFSKITKDEFSLIEFLSKMGTFYFGCQNKYIRKFSVAAISYVLSNLDEEIFKKFLVRVISTSEGNEQVLPYISDILAQRLKYSDGCLTPNSLQELITMVGWLSQLQIEDGIFIRFVHRVLANLQEKKTHEQNLTLFDFGYIVKAFIHLSREGKIKPRYVIEGTTSYLQEVIRGKRERKRILSEQILKQVSQFLWQYLPEIPNNQSIYHLLALSFSLPLQNVNNITNYLSKACSDDNILEFLKLINESIPKDTSMVILAGFKTQIYDFLTKITQDINQNHILISYKLFLIAKSHSILLNLQKMFDTKLDLKASIDKLVKLYKANQSIEKEKIYEYTLVFLRMLTIIELPSTLKTSLANLMNESLKNYKNITSYVGQNKKSQENIFFCSNFREQIFMYSHSSIGLVWQGFNIVQSFIQIQKSLGTKFIDRNNTDFKIWHKMVINRPSISNQIQQIFQSNPENYLIVLQSRHRVNRHITIQYIRNNKLFAQHDQLLQMLEQIQQDDVNLDTERNVKRMLLNMLRYLERNQLGEKLANTLQNWCLGFAFTGFKLIDQSLANFLTGLIQLQDHINLNTLIRFLEYYTFRNSRVYEEEIAKFFANTDIQSKELKLSNEFTALVNTDFENYELETVEFIGVDRVALAISKSEKVKKKLGDGLLNIINQYFDKEFVRFKKTLIRHEGSYLNEAGEVNQLLQPPKTTFLKQILKIVPADYLPPLECLHYTSEYLKLESVLKIKRQSWQLLWSKATKMDHTRIRFESMSSREMEVYIHFLWGELLKADANKLRIIIEHIRDHMNHKVEYFMDIFYNELTLKVTDQDELKKIFLAMDSRKFLTFIYILKCIGKTLKNYVRNNYEKVLKILVNIIEVLQTPKEVANNENQMEAEEQKDEDEENEQISQNEQVVPEENRNKKYKNHRKQVFKILNSLIGMLADEIEVEPVDNILFIFAKQNKLSTLGKVSLHSTPGLLLFFRELSKHPKFHFGFTKYGIFKQIQQIFSHGFSLQSSGSVAACVQIMNGLLGIFQTSQMADEAFKSIINSEISAGLLQSVFTWISSMNKVRPDLETQLLQIVLHLMRTCQSIGVEWQKYLMGSMSRIVSMKTTSEANKKKLAVLIEISMQYEKKASSSEFLISMLTLIPQLKEIEHRKLIVNSIAQDLTTGKQKTIKQQAVSIVTGLNSTIDGGLIIEIDYQAFFNAINKYKEVYTGFNIYEHEFVIYNVMAYLSSPELSVRKAVGSTIDLFLNFINVTQRDLVSKLFRIIGEELKKPHNSEDQVFWSIFACLGHFVRWVIKNDIQQVGAYQYFAKFISTQNPNNDIFDMLCAIAQNRKLDGLKAFKSILKQEHIDFTNKPGVKYPNALTTIILPALEHFILPITQTTKDRYQIAGNLTSSLSHVSLEVFELAMKKGGQSLQKKQLKRMISKIKFDDGHLKKNILLIKIISQIVQSIDLPRVTEAIHKIVSQGGVEDFHKKIVEKQSRKSKIQEDDESDSEEQIRKKAAFNGINNEIDDDELINMGYLSLDKKLLQAEEDDKEQEEENSIIKFLRVNVLLPLKTMLMFQNRSQKNAKEQTDKSRMFLSIVVTKIILKFPTDIFVNELQKILSKLGKLLKKKQIEVRENSRKCLAEIAKLIGPDMFYLVFRQLKFHLRDNFQNHVLNYTIYYILEKYGNLESGAIDHCLPIILPSIIDEIYGKSAAEKEMVDQNLIPTLNMESKKRKGNDLLSIICKQISMKKIDYLVKYFEKFLLDYMNTQTNVARYEQMLTNIVGGLNKNDHIMKVENSSSFIEIVHESIEKLKGKIKLYKFDDSGVKHESTVKQEHGGVKKAGKEVLELQEQAGRNSSIFKKQAKQIQQRRNHEILVGCFMQFHLAVLALLIKKRIINSEEQSQKFESVITFIVECIEHRDNRLVHKCLKVLHNVIHWKKMPNIGQIRKKTSRKIFPLIEKLTSADEDLLRQCFTLLNDLFEEIKITTEVLHTLVAIIKLHINTVDSTIAEQPYKLLKTVLIKIADDHSLLFDPNVYQLYEFVRANLISTTLDNIRSICREICSIYIRQNPQPTQDKKKNKRRTTLDYRKQISFYLNNLDCKYSQTQQALLSVIKAFVASHEKEEVEETGEVIVMTLGTAYSNDADNERQISDLVRFVVQKIDNSKAIGLIDKCLVWVSNQNEMISICGFFLLQNILLVKGSALNAQRKNLISAICTKVLEKQVDKVQLYSSDLKEKFHQSKTLKQNPEWEGILQKEDTYLAIQKCFKFALGQLNYLLDEHKIVDSKQVELLWKLVSAPSSFIHAQVGSILLKINSITAVIGEKILSIDQEEEDSLKNKVFLMVKNSNESDGMEHCCKITEKVLQEIKQDQNSIQVFEGIVFSMLNRISKSILNLKRNEKSMLSAYDILQTVLTVDQQSCERMLKNQKLLGEIFWNIAKVNRNEMIISEIKEKNEQLGQIIKSGIGQAEFYRRLASVEAERKQKKNIEKAEMLKLAITDQEAYGKAKAKKKHKKE